MRKIIIPDVHQNIGWVREIDLRENFDSFDEVIFLCDFFDSHAKFDGVNIMTVRDVCDYLINLKIRLGKKLIMVLGNHDVAYMEYSIKARWNYSYTGSCYLSCSGFTGGKADDIHKIFWLYPCRGGQETFWNNFKFFHISEGVLYTHAGFSKKWLGSYYGEETIEAVAEKYLPKNPIGDIYEQHKLVSAIGKKRGGYDSSGGIVWCDLEEFEPIEYIPQVFGHTPEHNRIVEIGNSVCLDGGQTTYMIIDNGKREYKTTERKEFSIEKRQ